MPWGSPEQVVRHVRWVFSAVDGFPWGVSVWAVKRPSKTSRRVCRGRSGGGLPGGVCGFENSLSPPLILLYPSVVRPCFCGRGRFERASLQVSIYTLCIELPGKRLIQLCGCYLVDSASSDMLVSKIKPCMSKYKQIYTVKLRMAH
jgi:hypothetical protein